MLSCCLGGSRILGGSKERAVAEGDQALSSGPVVLVANRAEIACRIINACQKLSLKAVAVYTEADRGTTHTKLADEAIFLGGASSQYTSIPALLKAAKDCGATAIHPGYGFLSESPEFVAEVEAAGVVWLGPAAATIRDFALKHVAKDMAVEAGVPTLSGSPLVSTEEEAVAAAEEVGYPVLIKATGGGGGMGIYKCWSAEEVKAALPLAISQGQKSFGNGDVFVEKFIEKAKHIEVQVVGDGKGVVKAFGERECSVQRRHQKVVEESPSPFVDEELRKALCTAAENLCAAASYRSAGTVEFLVDVATRKFYFLEVNTRLQVEHGITELVTGTDLVEWMLRLQLPIAGGEGINESSPEQAALALKEYVCEMNGHAIECRLCAEDPCHGLTPSTGTIGEVKWPSGDTARVDTWITSGTFVGTSFDSLLAKVMVHAASRAECMSSMSAALDDMRVKGIATNAQLHQAIMKSDLFADSKYDTALLTHLEMQPSFVEVLDAVCCLFCDPERFMVLDAGVATTVQDFPGRTRLWSVGVPPSGPMDPLSLQYANAVVGNDAGAAALEVTLRGPKLLFHRNALVAVCGGDFDISVAPSEASSGGQKGPKRSESMWTAFQVEAGEVLTVGTAKSGARCYIAVGGGFDAPVYLGSRATFPSGNLGGYQGRPLAIGDTCELGMPGAEGGSVGATVPDAFRPGFGEEDEGRSGGRVWKVTMLQGPQTAPDYFTEDDMKVLTSAKYEVHYNSNRLGIRLMGPKPQFARPNGGDGGAHPSNVHDHVYPLGTVNFTGDMPIILTCDGPSLGGFVCPATTILADVWKWGQARPGDKIQFVLTTVETAVEQLKLQRARFAAVKDSAVHGSTVDTSALKDTPVATDTPTATVLRRGPDSIWRLAGDRYMFVEYGEMVLDFAVRAKVAKLEEWLKANAPEGFVEFSPGVRSALLEYDPLKLPLEEMLSLLEKAESALPDVRKLKIQSRVLRLPMAFRESKSKAAMDKYAQSVRPEAAYLPDNVPFVAEINGLKGGVEEVRKIMFEASYMVFGLGDVYLGAPCAVPVNPLHRLVCPKYNPARTFTHEGTVGLGGAYMCIYPMSSPGGYQLMGRTLPIWNTYGSNTPSFSPDKPWLLCNFDQVRFYEVPEEELEVARSDFASGKFPLEVSEEEFDFAAHADFCESIKDEVVEYRQRQAEAAAVVMAKDAEILKKLEAAGYTPGGGGGAAGDEDIGAQDLSAYDDDDKYEKVTAPFPASVWEVTCEAGATVAAGDQLCVLEAMKMETPVATSSGGTVVKVFAQKSALVARGQVLAVIELAQ